MANIHWRNPADGNFTTGTSFSTKAAGRGPDPDVNVSGVTLESAGAWKGGPAAAGAGGPHPKFPTVANSGTIVIPDHTYYQIGGVFHNGGVISLEGVFYGAHLIVKAGGATLTGGGVVQLGGSGKNFFYGATAGTLLTNLNNTISGQGFLGADSNLDASLTVINGVNGVIQGMATASHSDLIIDTAGLTNHGLIESAHTSDGSGVGLIIKGGAINNSDGTILATDGSSILVETTISGGTLNTAGNGVILGRGGELDGTASRLASTGLVEINGRYSLGIRGAIANSGSIVLDGGFYDDHLNIGSGGATLTGGGQLVVGGNRSYVQSVAAGDTLTNVDDTISGAGILGVDASGVGSLTLVNGARGVIDGNGGLNLRGNITNHGLIESTSAAGLRITSGEIINDALIEATSGAGIVLSTATIDGSGGGTILAADGGVVTLSSGGYVVGGTLSTAGSGVILSANGALDGTLAPVHVTGALNVANHAALAVKGTIDNTGTISVLGGGFYNSNLQAFGSGVTFVGDGQIVLGSRSYIYTLPGATFTNDGNTISGNGNFFESGTTVVNLAGTIDANGPTAMTLPTVGGVFTNGGVLEATGAGGLIIQSATVDQSTGGQIFAGNGSTVTLKSVVDIGGSFDTAGTGVIRIGDGGATLDGSKSAVGNQGALVIQDGETLTARGAIDNSGTMSLASTGTATDLVFDKNSTFTGGGTISLSANAMNTIEGTKGSVVLTNADNTIVGSGQLGGHRLTLVNQAAGVIDADGKIALVIDTGANAVTNAGLIETTGDGKLVIRSAVANTGTLLADGGTLTLNAAVTGSGAVDILKGTLDIANAGAMETVAFTGKSGKLELDQSQSFGGAVSGFSHTGKTSLDLRDIVFDGATAVSYSGTKSGGVLTVTHGAQVASIHLNGDYRSATFTLSDDGHGGTKVVDPPKAGAATAPVHRLAQAMADLGAGAGMTTHPAAEPWRAAALMLTAPRMHLA